MSRREEECLIEEEPECSRKNDGRQIFRILSREGHEFAMEKGACMHSVKLADMIRTRKMREVSSPMLKLIADWCTFHKYMPHQWKEPHGWYHLRHPDMITWAKKYTTALTPQQLLELATVANNLQIGSLVASVCDEIGGRLRGQTVEQMREMWNIPADPVEIDEKAASERKTKALEALRQQLLRSLRARKNNKRVPPMC
ncbi:unnamed protein product, partial [Mesorhabditis spiculigera]